MNKPVAWMTEESLKSLSIPFLSQVTLMTALKASQVDDFNIPLYTQDQLEEARKLGMQQERALWNLSESTQEIMNPYKAITDTKIEPTVVSYTHPVKEHFEDEPQAEELHEIMQSNLELTDEEIAVIGDKCFGTMSYELWVQTNEFARAILRKAQE